MQAILNLKESNIARSNKIHQQEHIIMVVDLSKIVKVSDAIITAIGLTVGAIDLEQYRGILL